MYSTWLAFPVQLPTLWLSCQVPALYSCSPGCSVLHTQRAQLVFQCSYHSVREFSWIVSSIETTEVKFWGSGCLLEAATSYKHWNKDTFLFGEPRAFSIWGKILSYFLQTVAFFVVTSTHQASFSAQDYWALGSKILLPNCFCSWETSQKRMSHCLLIPVQLCIS